MNRIDFEKAVKIIKSGGVVVAPTDTVYGLLADATDKNAVERVYRLKKRTPTKPVIVLVPSTDYLKFFRIVPKEEEKKLLEKKGITVVLDLPEAENFYYLHRGKGSIAFRIPDRKELIDFLRKVNRPVIAPSSNPEGEKPATDIQEAYRYFGESVDGYVDGGKVENTTPSTIVKIDGGIKIIREGTADLKRITELLKEEKR
ncbi:MAG: threonylcarbamoyl-AMP synthase [Aquificae bacterium]|nr:threonylcarbamoyl-AMP synthase [Aquificota bacterium]